MNAPKTELLAVVTRGEQVESWHRGALVVVRDGRVVHALGDPELPVYCRSAVKPMQALPLLESGLDTRLGLGNAELAVMCASHTGTPAHLAAVRQLLARGGVNEADLRCGPHAPTDSGANTALRRAGLEPLPIHNNCSGKHAGFLTMARALGQPLETYLDPEGQVQRQARAVLAEMAGVAPLDVATDGCGAPTFRLPLARLARAFAHFGRTGGAARERACARLFMAITAEPELYSGPGKLVAALVQSAPGKILPKNGAEGVFALGLPELGVGLALKIEDGSDRAAAPIVIAALQQLGVWSAPPPELARFARPEVKNTQGKVVGYVEALSNRLA